MCGMSQGYAVCCRCVSSLRNQILVCVRGAPLRSILSHFIWVSFSWLLMGLILTGIIFSCLTAESCHFLKCIDGNGKNGAVGLYRYYDTSDSQCVYHPEEVQYNESENAARTGAVVAPLAATFCLLIVIVEFCCCRFICSRLLMGLGLVCAQIMQGITFLLFDSEQFWCVRESCWEAVSRRRGHSLNEIQAEKCSTLTHRASIRKTWHTQLSRAIVYLVGYCAMS